MRCAEMHGTNAFVVRSQGATSGPLERKWAPEGAQFR